MKNITNIFLIALVFIAVSCTPSSTENDIQKVAIDYYQALNISDFKTIQNLHYDSVRVGGDGYFTTYSLDGYLNWLEWDSVFNPTYEIMELHELDGSVEVIVSKYCKRILFLNEEPTITKEVLKYKEGKIFSLTVTESISFNEEKWVQNREALLIWMRENHPEFDEFIYDQTKQGAFNYSTAIDLYLEKGNTSDQ